LIHVQGLIDCFASARRHEIDLLSTSTISRSNIDRSRRKYEQAPLMSELDPGNKTTPANLDLTWNSRIRRLTQQMGNHFIKLQNLMQVSRDPCVALLM
jgi:hypothetical protein